MPGTEPINQDLAAMLARGVIGLCQIRQKVLIEKTGISRTKLSQFLNRRIDLVEPELDLLLSELNLLDYTRTCSARLTDGQAHTEHHEAQDWV